MKFPPAFLTSLPARHIFAVCILAAALSMSGCARIAGSTSTKTTSQSSASAAGSTPNATWSEALQKWWQAFSQSKAPSKTPDTKQKQNSAPKNGEPSQAEITAIAVRHPAWKLADALEKNRAQPLEFEAIAGRSPVAGSTPKAPSFDVELSAATERVATAQANAERDLPAPALSANAPGEAEKSVDDFAAPIVIAPDAAELREAARARQENSIIEFLRVAQTRQNGWQRDYREVLKTALGEEIEVAEQRAPAALALVLPSPELQLEMSNLRLKLLSNVFSTPADHEKTSTRLQELMKAWRASLATQEKIRADELERLRVEEPARLRQVGLTRLEAQLETIRRVQQANREAIAAEHQARVEADFGNENTRLTLTLPPMPALGVLPKTSEPSSVRDQKQLYPFLEKIIFSRTRAPQLASVNGFSGVAASRTQANDAHSAQIHALRAEAWRDARRQAKMALRLKN